MPATRTYAPGVSGGRHREQPAAPPRRCKVMASPHAVAQLRTGLATASPGGFSITHAPSPAAARRAILQQQADGAVIFASQGPAQILTAGAQGLLRVTARRVTRPAAAPSTFRSPLEVQP